MRPLTVPRHTYSNIIETKCFTLNHVHESFLKQAHYTSAKSKKEESEFDFCNLKKQYLRDFQAPFVKQSNIKIALKLVEDVVLESSDCRLIIGEVDFVSIEESYIEQDGQIDLEKANDICVTGLNQYSSVKKRIKLPYARLNELPNFEKSKKPDNIVFDEESQSYNASLLPYATNIGSPRIEENNMSIWRNKGINRYNHILTNKIAEIKESYEQLIDEYNTNNKLYNAKYDFEPIIGETYHLYHRQKENSFFLSMIPPNLWDKEHHGSYKLTVNNVWIKVDQSEI